MSNTAYLRIGKLTISCTKREFDPTVLGLFSPSDKAYFLLAAAEAAEIMSDPDGAYEEIVVCKYCSHSGVVRDRLNLLGYTIPRLRRGFDKEVQRELEHLRTLRERFANGSGTRSEVLDDLSVRIELLNVITLDGWIAAANCIAQNGLKPTSELFSELNSDLQPVVKLILSNNFGDGIWYPGVDSRSLVRAFIEAIDAEQDIEYDLTEFVISEVLDLDEDLCAWARLKLTDELVLSHKIVVLTEGSVDRNALEGSFQVLYPHLCEYFSFMDFENARAPGGAGVLANTVKAFVGAGIANKIVAMFDNDTSARAAIRSLHAIELPDNVRVVHYPETSWAKCYPTIGPQGMSNMDVNGLAGSIELYFGLDVLRGASGNLTPVQWKSLDATLNQYQGELLCKSELQDRFFHKLKVCVEDADLVKQFDWRGIEAIISLLTTAFH